MLGVDRQGRAQEGRQVHDHRFGSDLRPAHDEGRERIQRVEQEVRIDLIMECATLRILRLEPIGVGAPLDRAHLVRIAERSDEHTSELQSLMRISYAVFCLKKTTIKLKITSYYKSKNNPKRILTL